MNFVEPLFLAGLLGALLPLVVHLINRRKAVRRPFPALKFLVESNKRVARSLKIRQWLLMALRMLVIGFLAFSLAKPFVLSDAGVTAEERLPTATVIVMDTSASMGFEGAWDEAIDETEAVLGRLRPWDEVALVATDGGGRRVVNRITADHGEIRDALDDLKWTEASANLVDGVRVASEMLAGSQLPNRRVVVVSDFARGSFPDRPEAIESVDYPVELVRVRGEDSPASLAIASVSYEEEGSRRDRTWRIVATVQNFGATDASRVQVELLFDGSVVSAGLVDVEAGRSVEYTFRHKVEGAGARRAAVRLSGSDEYNLDDTQHFAVHLDENVRALLVNGEASSVVYQDELFFFERALNPGPGSESVVVPSVTTREGLEGRELSDYDVIVLANVSHISALTARKLEAFVRGGGGLLLVMGDQVDPVAYNQTLGELLPKPLRGLKQLAERNDPDAPVKITRLGNVARTHPIFQVFEAPGGGTLQSAAVYSYMLLEPSPPERSETLLSFKDGAPALLERRVERGRVLLFNSTIDLEWTDLPTRTAFLPFSRRIVQYLARRATSEGSLEHRVGVPVELDVGALVQERLVLAAPDDVRVVLEPVDGIARYVPQRAGVYTVYAESAEDEKNRLPGLDFAVNVDIAESDLERLPAEALSKWTQPKEGADAVGQAGPQRRVNLWPFFLFMVTLFLLFESILGTRRSVLTRIWRVITRASDPALEE